MRGGPRKNSGRPRLGKRKRLERSITFRPDHYLYLRDRKASQEVEKALDAWIKKGDVGF